VTDDRNQWPLLVITGRNLHEFTSAGGFLSSLANIGL